LDGWADTSDSSVRRKDTEFDEQVILFSPTGPTFLVETISEAFIGITKVQSNFKNSRPILARLVACLEFEFNIKESGGNCVGKAK
jgi:hypothetical protein